MSKGILAALALGLLLPGCAKQNTLNLPAVTPPATWIPAATPGTGSDSPTEGSFGPVNYAAGKELYCLADTEEEAKEIAALYDIELVGFSYGVATFHTEENPGTVIARGKKNGWRTLSLNSTVTLTDPVEPGTLIINP